MLENFLIPELRRRRINTNHVWFQQDGAPAPTARATIFPGHLSLVSMMCRSPLISLTLQLLISFCGDT